LLLIVALAAAASVDAAAAKKNGGGKGKEVVKGKEKFSGDKNDPVIGIDLGTTYSCVAVFKEGEIEIVANDLGERTTPSWVAFTDTERLIGQAAKNQVHKNPKNTLYDVKRLIGRGFDDVEVQKDIKAFPFSVIDRNGKPYLSVKSQGKTQNMSPEEVSAMVLTRMKGALMQRGYIASGVRVAEPLPQT
jgi:heat shock protein 5